MRILYVGTDELLDWSRRKVLASAGYLVMDVHDLAHATEALGKGPRLAILSNLISETERDRISNFLAIRFPDVLRMAFEGAKTLAICEPLPRHLEPNAFLKAVGAALMRQHQHPEIDGKYFVYLDYRGRYLHVSDGLCALTGFRREEIIGRRIECLADCEEGPEPCCFGEYRELKDMRGKCNLRSKRGPPIPTNYESTVLPDGCLCSEFSPEENGKTRAG